MAFPELKCSLTLLATNDPTGQGRQLWRLKQLPNEPSNQTRWGPPSTNDYFDLVVAPSSNGRHRLLIYKANQLQDVAQLQDVNARRRTQVVSEAQPAKDAERQAVLALQQEDRSVQFTLRGDRVISLFVTREAPPASVARALRALPSLEKVTLFWGPLTTNIAEALSTLRHLQHLDCNSSTIDDGAFAHLGKLSQLEVLEIHHPNRITDRVMPHIAKLTNLTTLAINTEFHPRPNNWRELVLSEQGIAHVATLKRLTHLNLHGQNASDASCAQIAQLPRLTNLALSGERLTDAGLAALKGITNLTDLHLWDVAITKPAAEAFRRPGLHFEPGPFGKEHE
jgi:Leucine-rich repeat (LRR) protein